MKKEWKEFEDYTRAIASIIFCRNFVPERIDGVNFDGVARISDEETILLEITEEFNLEKIRGDIAKIAGVKLNFAIQGVFAKAYIILKKEPTPGMAELGKASRVSVLSITSFAKEAFDFTSYVNLRNTVAFGSAINPTTGEPDERDYVPVVYTDDAEKRNFTINDICKKLERGEKLILLGDYGTGKSRCVKETFSLLTQISQRNLVFAINLREHWGASTAVEIVAGHLQRLGMSSSIDRAMQLLTAGHILLLLDGFDEVGSQTFGTNQNRRATIRREALQGIRELIKITPSGVLITGRPHYFHSNKEMLDCLGISPRINETFLIKCAAEFNQLQAREYLDKIGVSSPVPQWLPRKPLMFLILAEVDKKEAERILSGTNGEIGFWGQFIDTLCIREARIHSSIDPASVRSVLTRLAQCTRCSERALGRLTPKDVNQAYEDATGFAPDESGQLMLSRLCTLGRIEPESPDRQFVDPYIVQLLFAESLVDEITNKNYELLEENWRQELQEIGLYFLSEWIDLYDLSSETISMLHRHSNPKNTQVIGELVSALSMIGNGPIDFSGLQVRDAQICRLPLGVTEMQNIQFIECIFGSVSVESCLITPSSYFTMKRCYISMITGITSAENLPSWILDCTIDNTQSASNSSRIKTSNLPAAQKLFLSIIQKIFFQRGGGRKESSLYKGGFGQRYDRKLIDQILNILVNQGYIERSKDNSGFIYNPKREYTEKMKSIKDQLALSKDPLWIEMNDLT